MKAKLITMCCLCLSYQASASVDWASMKATLVDEQALSTMRGKYLSSRSGEDLYFGVRMLTHWSDSSSAGSAGMDIVIDGRNVTVRPLDGSQTRNSVDDSNIHGNGSGMVQLVQIAGSDNAGFNDSALKFVEEGGASSNSLSVTSGVEYYHITGDENRVGYKVSIGDSIAIQEIRSLKTSHGAYQGINIQGEGLVIRNQMLMEVKLPDSWQSNKDLTVSHSLLKGL